MANNTQVQVTQSSPFLALLAVAFVVLKLLGHITWSWWWVLAPLWVPFAIVLAIVLIAVVVTVVRK